MWLRKNIEMSKTMGPHFNFHNVSKTLWFHLQGEFTNHLFQISHQLLSPFICLGFSLFWGKIGDHFSFGNLQKTLFLHLRFYLLLHVLSQICALSCRIIANATFVETWLPATLSLSLSITQLLLLSHSECYVPKGQGLVKLLSCTALVLRPVFCMITGSKTKKQTGLQFHLKVVDPMGSTSLVENALIIHQVHCGVPCKFW